MTKYFYSFLPTDNYPHKIYKYDGKCQSVLIIDSKDTIEFVAAFQASSEASLYLKKFKEKKHG